jgi:DNA-binding NarL/FixJ family response regulator
VPVSLRQPTDSDHTQARQVRVVTVDDQASFRDVARSLIELTPGFEPAGESCSGSAALELVREVEPDMVLMDVWMPGLDGIETARRLVAERPGTVVVLVSSGDLGEIAPLAESCGATALVAKQDLRPRLLTALWETHLHR